MSTKLRSDQICELIQEGFKAVHGSIQSIIDEYGYDYVVTAHQVVQSDMQCIIRDKVVLDLDIAYPESDLYAEIWYNTKYTKTSRHAKVYVPSFTVEVRFYSENWLTNVMKRNYIHNKFSCVERHVPCEIELAATILQNSASLYQDAEGNLLFDWDVDTYQRIVPSPYIDSADVTKFAYGLDDETELEAWGINQLRGIIDNAADAGFPILKRRCIYKGEEIL